VRAGAAEIATLTTGACSRVSTYLPTHLIARMTHAPHATCPFPPTRPAHATTPPRHTTPRLQIIPAGTPLSHADPDQSISVVDDTYPIYKHTN